MRQKGGGERGGRTGWGRTAAEVLSARRPLPEVLSARRPLPRYTKASEAGVPEAQFVLGWRYATGQGCEINDELAINLYRKVDPEHVPCDCKPSRQPVRNAACASMLCAS